MALTELAAFDAAYQILSPLPAAARRRALQWLADALGEDKPLREEQTVATTAAVNGLPVRRATKAAKATKASSQGRTRRKAPAPVKAEGRAYRRMPDPGEVMAAYRQIGTIAGVAEHFDVPAYTVNSWARRLRNDGYQIGRSR